MSETIYLDLETTGLESDDEFVQIAIIDNDKNILLDTLSKPVNYTLWESAQRIHGISPADVKNAPTNAELKERILNIVTGKTVVIYNSDFDCSFIPYIYDVAKKIECCMHAFAEFYGEWHEYFESYTWKKLSFASKYCKYQNKLKLKSHNALGDCFASRHVWIAINTPKYTKIIRDHHKNIRQEKESEIALYSIECKKKNSIDDFYYHKIEPAIDRFLHPYGFYAENYACKYDDKFNNSYKHSINKYFREKGKFYNVDKFIELLKKTELQSDYDIPEPDDEDDEDDEYGNRCTVNGTINRSITIDNFEIEYQEFFYVDFVDSEVDEWDFIGSTDKECIKLLSIDFDIIDNNNSLTEEQICKLVLDNTEINNRDEAESDISKLLFTE